MQRPRSQKVASTAFVVALTVGLLVAGHGGSSQAGHERCGLDPTPSRSPDIRKGAKGVRVEQGSSGGRPYVGVFAPGTFVVADGDHTGARVYGATGATHPAFGTSQWFVVGIEDDRHLKDLKVCGKPH